MTREHTTIATLFVCLACVFLPGTMRAQETLHAEQNRVYLMQPEDILDIVVWPLDELSMEIAVRPDGNISFPIGLNKTADQIRSDQEYADLVLDPEFEALAADPNFMSLMNGSEIMVRNMTVSRLSLILRLRLNPIARNPRVAVNVKNFRHMRAFVLGAVKEPGLYEIRAGDTVLDLITRAGGVTDEAKQSKIAIIRPPRDIEPFPAGDLSGVEAVSGNSEPVAESEIPKNMIAVNLAEIVGQGVFPDKSEYMILNGDIVYVPKGNKVDWRKIYTVITSLYYAFSIDGLLK